MTELCEMCEHYLTDKCSEEKRRQMRNDMWDGFKVYIDSCSDYKRVEIQHKEEA